MTTISPATASGWQFTYSTTAKGIIIDNTTAIAYGEWCDLQFSFRWRESARPLPLDGFRIASFLPSIFPFTVTATFGPTTGTASDPGRVFSYRSRGIWFYYKYWNKLSKSQLRQKRRNQSTMMSSCLKRRSVKSMVLTAFAMPEPEPPPSETNRVAIIL